MMKPGDVIDRYKLLEKLGEGGFGTVWAAEQKRPVKRRVALKVIKLGMDNQCWLYSVGSHAGFRIPQLAAIAATERFQGAKVC